MRAHVPVCPPVCPRGHEPFLPSGLVGWSQARGPGPTTSHSPLSLSGEVFHSLGSLGPLKINSFQDFKKSGGNWVKGGSPRVNPAILDNELSGGPSSFVLALMGDLDS